MTARPAHVPSGYHTTTPYLVVNDAQALIAFCEDVFGASSVVCNRHPDGRVQHGEVRWDDSLLMVGSRLDGTSAMESMLYVYVPNVDATYATAIKAGARSLEEPKDQSYGDRRAAVIGPQGVHWYLATRKQQPPEDAS